VNRNERRTRLSIARKRASWEWIERPITDEDRANHPASRDIRRAFLNDFFSVQVYEVETDIGEVLHLIIRPQDGNALSQPSWAELQRIKNELIGHESCAIQFYPRESHLRDSANLYHLWVLPVNVELPFGLHREQGLRNI
jgi:hypothetical protein